MQQQIEITDKKQIFAQRYTGEYATRKGINRSSKDIPDQYINDIEAGNVTSTMIEELNKIVPVFVYKTCITVHGNLPEIGIKRIGGYANVIQNGNGSIEFRYSAIDRNIKHELATYLKGHYSRQENSTNGIYFEKVKRFNERAEAVQYLQEERVKVESMNIKGMKANINVCGYSYFGTYYIITTILPLLITGDVLDIAVQLTGATKEQIQDNANRIKAEREEQDKQWKERQKIADRKREADEATRAQMEAILMQSHRPTKIDGVGTYLTTAKTGNGLMYQFIQTFKGSFGRLTYKYKLSNDPQNFDGEFKDGMKGKQLKPSEITNKTVFSY